MHTYTMTSGKISVDRTENVTFLSVLASSVPCATCELYYWCITVHMAVSKMTTISPPSGAYLTDGACLSSKFHHVALKDAVDARRAAPDTRLTLPPQHSRFSRSKSRRAVKNFGEHKITGRSCVRFTGIILYLYRVSTPYVLSLL